MEDPPPHPAVSGPKKLIFVLFLNSGKDPWVDSACADCPGFGVLGAAPALASTLVLERQIVPLGQHFASWAIGHLLGSAARSSLTTRAKTGRTAHVFTAQGGTRRLFSGLTRERPNIFRKCTPPSKVRLNDEFKAPRWHLPRWRLGLSDFSGGVSSPGPSIS